MRAWVLQLVGTAHRKLDAVGAWVGLLSLRVLLAWEFGEAGWQKWRGHNWFADIQDQLPWPFHALPADFNWHLAMGFELLGALALLLGWGTRFFSAGLLVLTAVAMFSVHWPESWSGWAEWAQGYVFTDQGQGNFKFPVILMAMLWPLLCLGAGPCALDAWLRRWSMPKP